jgi:hypothetical protein
VTREIPASTSFNTYSSSSGNQLEMDTRALRGNIATHINYVIHLSDNPEDQLILGMRLGYNIPLNKTHWTMNKTSMDKGPNINPGGYFAMLAIGFRY